MTGSDNRARRGVISSMRKCLSVSSYAAVLVLVVFLSASAWAEKVALEDDPPLVLKPKPGKLTGRIAPAEKVQTLKAVSRVTGKTYLPRSLDEKTGEFTFTALPGDAVYDICVATADGRRIEGIDLDFVDARMLRLAEVRRKQLGLPEKKKPSFTRRDVEAILKFAAGWEDFMDFRRILYIRGYGNRATVLIELMRLREFHDSRKQGGETGDLVWRIELWYMEKRGGGWERIPNVERVLHRLRAKPAEWRKIHVEYYPRMSVRIDAKGRSDFLDIILPDTPDASRGRPANTRPKLKTKPHVLGLDEPSTRPAKKKPQTRR
ncbi:MAG TPA: hypothetical protein ENH84_07130 [Phycisphaerae bacterium]|nr:hypothetical protein [Phycisphaerae bacterium]